MQKFPGGNVSGENVSGENVSGENVSGENVSLYRILKRFFSPDKDDIQSRLCLVGQENF